MIPLDPLLWGARLADMKEVDYRNTLALASLIELLVEKGVLERGELAWKARALDAEAEAEATASARRHPSYRRI